MFYKLIDVFQNICSVDCGVVTTPIQYNGILMAIKNVNFLTKNEIFLISAQNIDCGYSVEPPH